MAFALFPAAAHADDWLALHPECAFDAGIVSPGRMALLYPRVGLPAVVEQGARLVTRVRVPSGLTPPPGIQQDRALVGWSAELVGDAIAQASSARHRYPLRVVDVRPDGPSSLVYRATILVPHWAAPGTYGLRMSAPGGSDALAASVRVLARGEVPRLAMLRFEGAPSLAALSHLPADVWIAEDEPRLRATLAHAPMPDASGASRSAPILLLPRDPDALAVVLRHGEEAIVLGACDGRFVRFEDELRGLLAQERRTRRALDRDRFPEPGRFAWLDAGGGGALPDREIDVRIEDGVVTVSVPDDHPAEVALSIAVPDDGRSTELTGAPEGAAWYPATPVIASAVTPTLAVRFVVAPGRAVTLSRGEPAPLSLEVLAEPRDPETAVPVSLRAVPSRPVERIAWQLDEDATAVGEEARRAYGPLGLHRIRALAIASDGVGARGEAAIEVRTREVTGCDCRAAGAASSTEFWLPALLLLLPLARNRPRAPHR